MKQIMLESQYVVVRVQCVNQYGVLRLLGA